VSQSFLIVRLAGRDGGTEGSGGWVIRNVRTGEQSKGGREGRTYLNLFMMAFAERSTPLMICRS